MFGIIVERFIEVLKEALNGGSKSTTAVSTTPVVILSEESHKKVDKYVSFSLLSMFNQSRIILCLPFLSLFDNL